MKKYIRASYDHRYSAGRIEEDGTEDFYYDTGFDSWDEAVCWGDGHDCTHIYDRQTGEYLPITSAKQTKYFTTTVNATSEENVPLATEVANKLRVADGLIRNFEDKNEFDPFAALEGSEDMSQKLYRASVEFYQAVQDAVDKFDADTSFYVGLK